MKIQTQAKLEANLEEIKKMNMDKFLLDNVSEQVFIWRLQ